MADQIQLAPGQTLREYNAEQRLRADCGLVLRTITAKPGIPAKWMIADETGLGHNRVARCIRMLKSGEFSEYHRIEYGELRPRGGPYTVGARDNPIRGWYPMRLAIYHRALDQADTHEDSIIRGVQRSRVARLVQIETGMTSVEARKAVLSISDRLGVDLSDSKFSGADEETLVALILEEINANGSV